MTSKIPILLELAPWQTRPVQPPLVRAALDLAARLRFEHSCSPEVGSLLAVLAGSVRHGRIGEIGTGCGVGTAWMHSALRPDARLVSIESDANRARAAGDVFASETRVKVLQGDWHEILDKGPFELLFIDARAAKEAKPETFLRSLVRGGMMLLDDFTPLDQLPAGKPDAIRESWLGHPAFRSAELRISPSMAIILASKA